MSAMRRLSGQEQKMIDDARRKIKDDWEAFIKTERTLEHYVLQSRDIISKHDKEIIKIEKQIEQRIADIQRFSQKDDDKRYLDVVIKDQKITQDKLLKEMQKRDYYLRLPGFLVEFVRRHVRKEELRDRIWKTEQRIHEKARMLIEKETKQDKAQLAEIEKQMKESKLDGKTCLHHSPDGTYCPSFHCEFCTWPLKCTS